MEWIARSLDEVRPIDCLSMGHGSWAMGHNILYVEEGSSKHSAGEMHDCLRHMVSTTSSADTLGWSSKHTNDDDNEYLQKAMVVHLLF